MIRYQLYCCDSARKVTKCIEVSILVLCPGDYRSNITKFAFPPAESAMPAKFGIEIEKWEFHTTKVLVQVCLKTLSEFWDLPFSVIVSKA